MKRMYAITKNLPRTDALQFAKSMGAEEKYYIFCAVRNPKERHLARREGYVVIREIKKDEVVPQGRTVKVNEKELIEI